MTPLPPSHNDSGWAALPTEILISIFEYLHLADCVRFGSVCSSFYYVFQARQYLSSSSASSPWIFLPEDSTGSTINFFSITEGKTYKIPQPVPPITRPLWLGCSDGWLVTLDQETQLISLFNPVARNQINLPPLAIAYPSPALHNLESSNAIISWNPSPSLREGYKVVLLLAWQSSPWPSTMLCIQDGGRAWTSFGETAFYKDAVIHKGQLYTMQSCGTVEVWDFAGPTLLMTILTPPCLFVPLTKYLVDSKDCLLQVWRSHKYSEAEFRIFKLDISKEWVEMESLEDQVLFLNNYSSVSLSSRDYPELGGNCIFFNRLTSSLNREIFVYMLENKSAKRLLHGPYWKPSSVWIRPSLL